MFVTRLQLELDDDGLGWRVLAPLIWREAGPPVVEYVVPDGFSTDLDSVPRLPVIYLLLKDRARAAAVLHDWLYTIGGRPGAPSRAEADRVFRVAMAATHVPFWQRWLIWAGVRVGGRPAFTVEREGL